MSLFPMIQPDVEITKEDYPLYKETAWDYKENIPVYKNGSPVIVEGKDAVLVWAWKALHTERYRYEIYTWDYGSEIETLIGQPYTEDLKRAEAIRYVRECLLVNPYISEVSNISVDFNDGLLSIQCRMTTVYGEVDLHV